MERIIFFCSFAAPKNIVYKRGKIMTEITETKSVYQSPYIEVLSFEAEGVLCMSGNIPDWELNDDIL